MKKRYSPIIALIMLLVIAVPVIAYTYYAQLSVTESSGNNYTELPLIATCNNTYIADNGFGDADLLDSDVTTATGTAIASMLTDNRTIFSTPLSAYQQVNLLYTLGNSPVKTAFNIVLGWGGYFTVNDSANMEPTNDFVFTLNGFINTNEVSDNICYKEDAFVIEITNTGNITAGIPSLEIQGVGNNWFTVCGQVGYAQKAGQRVDSIIQGTITQVTLYMVKSGSPTGTGYVRVRRVSDESILATLGSIDVSTIGVTETKYTFNDATAHINNEDVRIVFEYDGGNASNCVAVRIQTSNVSSFGYATSESASVWTDATTQDAKFKIFWIEGITSVVGSSGEYKIEVIADTVELTMEIDDVQTANLTPIGSWTVPDNANNWSFMSEAVPYADNITWEVSSTLIAHFEPNDIIVGSTLPDREGADNTGTIVYGTNPAGVAVSLGGLISEDQVPFSIAQSTDSASSITSANISDWYSVSSNLTGHIIYPLVNTLDSHSGLSEDQIWAGIGLMTILGAMLLSFRFIPHLFITGIVGAGVSGYWVAIAVFPFWILIIFGFMIIASIIWERTVSV